MWLPTPVKARLSSGNCFREEECRDATTKYGSSFKVAMGGEAIKTLLGQA